MYRYIFLNLYGAFGYLFCIIFIGLRIQCVDAGYPVWNATWVDKLKRDLFFKYDKFARPTQHYNTTRAYFGMQILHISVDEFKSAINVKSWVHMRWEDEKLKWNSSLYGGLTTFQVGNHEVWQPDIFLWNSVAVSSVEHYGDTNCHLHEDGTVAWIPPTQFKALCDLDLRLWPFDTQICFLQLGSWSHHGNEIDLKLVAEKYSDNSDDLIVGNSEWKIIEVTRLRNVTFYPCCPNAPYIYLKFSIIIKRNSPLYNSIILKPAAVIVIMSLVSFWLPSDRKEKLILCACNAIISSIFLLYFANKIPPHSPNTPLIVSFYNGCLVQITISLIVTAIVINLSHRAYCKPLPRNVKKILTGWPGKYLGLSDLINAIQVQDPVGEQELRESHVTDSSVYGSNLLSNSVDSGDRENIIYPRANIVQLEWKLAATAIDRMCFLIFCTTFSLMAITCLS